MPFKDFFACFFGFLMPKVFWKERRRRETKVSVVSWTKKRVKKCNRKRDEKHPWNDATSNIKTHSRPTEHASSIRGEKLFVSTSKARLSTRNRGFIYALKSPSQGKNSGSAYVKSTTKKTRQYDAKKISTFLITHRFCALYTTDCAPCGSWTWPSWLFYSLSKRWF